MDDPTTLPFESFWTWLSSHPNCILRAGTPIGCGRTGW